jgi:hypothetical protein
MDILKFGLCVNKLYITAAVLLFRILNGGDGSRKFEVIVNQI